MSFEEKKRLLRTELRKELESFRPQMAEAQVAMSASLAEFLRQQVGMWSAYQAIADEVNVADAVRAATHLRWAFPRVEGEVLKFYQGDSFAKGPWGIQEPSDLSSPVDINSLTGLLIPGLGFSVHGHRLGRGKGFFDKTVGDLDCLKVGVCWHLQLSLEELPVQGHDVEMNWVITEKAWVDCRKKEVRPWKLL